MLRYLLVTFIPLAVADNSHLLSVEFASGGGTVSYGVSVAGELFFASSRPLVFVNHKWHTPTAQGSPIIGTGTDAIGAYSSTTIKMLVQETGTQVDVAVRSYPERNAAVFSTTFPSGANGTNCAVPGGNACPSVNFPSFATDAAKLSSLGFRSWSGVMSTASNKAPVRVGALASSCAAGKCIARNPSDLSNGTYLPTHTNTLFLTRTLIYTHLPTFDFTTFYALRMTTFLSRTTTPLPRSKRNLQQVLTACMNRTMASPWSSPPTTTS